MDLVILFVKSLFSRAALSGNNGLIGPDTYVMTFRMVPAMKTSWVNLLARTTL